MYTVLLISNSIQSLRDKNAIQFSRFHHVKKVKLVHTFLNKHLIKQLRNKKQNFCFLWHITNNVFNNTCTWSYVDCLGATLVCIGHRVVGYWDRRVKFILDFLFSPRETLFQNWTCWLCIRQYGELIMSE